MYFSSNWAKKKSQLLWTYTKNTYGKDSLTAMETEVEANILKDVLKSIYINHKEV